MGEDGSSNAYVFIGALLSKKKVLELWGTRYENMIYGNCPKDKTPNENSNNFCSKCGTNLRYKQKLKEGIKDIEEADEGFAIAEAAGLETMLIRSDSGGSEETKEIMIGKKITETNLAEYSLYNGIGIINPKDREKAIPYVKERLAKLGIKTPVKEYVITMGG
jgi:hypothetical protein